MTELKRTLRCAFAMTALLWLCACASKPPVPEDPGKPFVLERDLVGKTTAQGSFSAIDGTHREFTVAIDGSWDGEKLTLVEDFVYDNGDEERKTWVFTKLPNGEFSGTREDVVGTARGYQDGDVFRLEYIMALPRDDGTPGRKLRFRDIIYNQPDGTIANYANVGLWGFKVATVSLLISPA